MNFIKHLVENSWFNSMKFYLVGLIIHVTNPFMSGCNRSEYSQLYVGVLLSMIF
jgi:hypothetical protein